MKIIHNVFDVESYDSLQRWLLDNDENPNWDTPPLVLGQDRTECDEVEYVIHADVLDDHSVPYIVWDAPVPDNMTVTIRGHSLVELDMGRITVKDAVRVLVSPVPPCRHNVIAIDMYDQTRLEYVHDTDTADVVYDGENDNMSKTDVVIHAHDDATWRVFRAAEIHTDGNTRGRMCGEVVAHCGGNAAVTATNGATVHAHDRAAVWADKTVTVHPDPDSGVHVWCCDDI